MVFRGSRGEWRQLPAALVEIIDRDRGPTVAPTNHETTVMLARDGVAPAADLEQMLPADANQMLRALDRVFERTFSVLDCSTGVTLRSVGDLPVDLYKRLATCEEIAKRGRPEILDEVSPLVLFAVPLVGATPGSSLVAVAPFVTERVQTKAEIEAAAQEFGLDVEKAFEWAKAQRPWPPQCLLELSGAIAEKST